MLWAESRFSACFAAHCHPWSLPRRAIADAKIDSFETPLARDHLAAALALLGDRPRAEAVFAKATERAVALMITENEAAFARLLLVDRLPAGLEIDNPDLFKGGSTEALSNLIVGRKGSGKTALFIQLRNRIRSDRDRRNIVVDLRPEGYQLIKIKEDIFTYLNEGARQHLITAFYFIRGCIHNTANDRNTYNYDHSRSISRFGTDIQN